MSLCLCMSVSSCDSPKVHYAFLRCLLFNVWCFPKHQKVFERVGLSVHLLVWISLPLSLFLCLSASSCNQFYIHRFIMLSFAVCFSTYDVFQNTKKYLNASTVTTISSIMSPLDDLTFPSIYICNVNQVQWPIVKNRGRGVPGWAIVFGLNLKGECSILSVIVFWVFWVFFYSPVACVINTSFTDIFP
jgi:hypothetical protein